jgi:hypothetical protein
MEHQKMEETEAYKLGTAIALLQEVIGTDSISRESVSGKKFIKKHLKANITKFLKEREAEHKKVFPEDTEYTLTEGL